MTSASVRILAVLLVPLIAAGCSDTTPTGVPGDSDHELQPGYALLAAGSGISLDLEPEAFESGAEVTLVLRNDSDERVGHNLCFHLIERLEDGEWAAADEQEARICTTILHLLDPSGTATHTATVPEALPAGEYRYRVALYLVDRGAGEYRDQVTATFTIQ
jgi:hypothetical protein